MNVINIRGTNGSGKTTLLKRLVIEDKLSREIEIGPHKTKGHYIPSLYAIVVGSYAAGQPISGMDRVKTTAEAVESVIAAATGDHTGGKACCALFEGVIISTVWSTWLSTSEILRRRNGTGMTWAFLQTPVWQCLERISARQRAKGAQREIDKKLVEGKQRSIDRIRHKAMCSGEIVVDLPIESEYNALVSLIMQSCKA
ncbi:hypothetical protein UFOVP731_60 [uncultured Caudovirales phage]|uniref:AAA domain containing protein n=1 Tax=uncultured Caudovirales phage TaxID=2100421 RepID=A0A6J5NNW8_9CAUD|nr:hypothetical protein UFOVP731_60 [uncultured Caudovirales phage]